MSKSDFHHAAKAFVARQFPGTQIISTNRRKGTVCAFWPVPGAILREFKGEERDVRSMMRRDEAQALVRKHTRATYQCPCPKRAAWHSRQAQKWAQVAYA